MCASHAPWFLRVACQLRPHNQSQKNRAGRVKGAENFFRRQSVCKLMSDEAQGVTELLRQAQAGNRGALDELLPHVYRELKGIAARQLAGERPGHTLQATALVNEAYLRLVDQHSVDWRN